MTDYLYRAKQAHPTSEMEIALQEALKNDEFGDVRTVRNPDDSIAGLSAGGEAIPPVSMSKKLYAAIRPLVVADQSLRFFVAGDSTGNDTDEWAYLLAVAMAAKYPAHTHDYRLWNDTSQQYDQTVRLATGTAGAAHVDTGLAAASWRYTIDDAAAISPTGDIDLRAVVNLNGSLPNVQMALCGKFTTSGNQRSWRFDIKTDGTLYLANSADGITAVTRVSTGVLSGTDLTGPIHLRVTLDVDNGASGNTATFYKSTDGVTWTSMGAIVTATATAIFDSTAIFQFIGSSGASLPTQDHAISFYAFSAYASLDGTARFIDIDVADALLRTTTGTSTFVDRCGNTVTQISNAANGVSAGAPALLFSNGSKGGSTISYHTDETRYPKLVHGAPHVAIINHGHNDWTLVDAAWRTAYKSLTDLLIASNADAAICVLTQNQRGETSDHVAEHRNRIRGLVDFAGSQGFDVIDTWPHVTQAMHPVDDPVHPDAAGKLVQSGVVNRYFGL